MAHPIESYPTHQRGDFLSGDRRNPVYDSAIVYEDETEQATIREHRIRMDDRAEYKLSEVRPKHQAIDVAYVRTPAWTTSHNKGYEQAYALAMADLGIPVISISPQQNKWRIGNMSKSAHDYVEAGQYIADQSGFDPTHFVSGGSSRGGMYSHAFARVAGNHGAEADYIDSIGAAMPGGINLRKIKRSLGKLAKEPASLVQMMRDDRTGHMGILLDTITRDSEELVQQGKEIVALIDGSVQRNTIKMPAGTFGFLQQYIDDGLSDDEAWPPIFDQFGNVYQRYDPGTHFHCVGPEALAQSIERMKHVRDGIKGGAAGSIALHNMVGVGNPVFEGENEPYLSIVEAS